MNLKRILAWTLASPLIVLAFPIFAVDRLFWCVGELGFWIVENL